jgi:hypothetical protein
LVDCVSDVVDFCGGVVGPPAEVLHVSFFCMYVCTPKV